MNKEIKDKWIEALESGDYKQTRRTLRDEDGYCCLGVLCSIAEKAGIGTWKFTENDTYEFVCVTDHHSSILPRDVQTWADIDTNGQFARGKCLAGENDEGKSFKTIADLIREHL